MTQETHGPGQPYMYKTPTAELKMCMSFIKACLWYTTPTPSFLDQNRMICHSKQNKKYVSELFKTAVTIRSRRMIKHFNENDWYRLTCKLEAESETYM